MGTLGPYGVGQTGTKTDEHKSEEPSKIRGWNVP